MPLKSKWLGSTYPIYNELYPWVIVDTNSLYRRRKIAKYLSEMFITIQPILQSRCNIFIFKVSKTLNAVVSVALLKISMELVPSSRYFLHTRITYCMCYNFNFNQFISQGREDSIAALYKRKKRWQNFVLQRFFG